jgi:repressor LexA
MLTRKQFELLRYINDYQHKQGFSPSYDEMKEALTLRSKSGVHRLIRALEERGAIRRRPHRARSIEILIDPDSLRQPASARLVGGEPAVAFAPNVIKGNFAPRLQGARTAPEAAAVHLPLYGRIAAGLPIEAMANSDAQIEVPSAWLARGDHYALEVAGDSMIDEGIHEGDTVIIQKTETAENGDIVVALVEENEVTLKRFRRRGASIALEPANPRYETRIYPSEKVRVQGKLVALLRRY